MKEIRSLTEWTRTDPGTRERWRDEAIERARTEGADHGVFITVLDDGRRERGGELAGIPFAVKDNIDVAGTPTTAGSPLLAHGAPSIDAGIVSMLREAGAELIGKTNMHELAFGITSNNAHFGPVRNPLDPARTAGGSSGGSAAAVALGIVPFSIGTDTGASVTVPASFCGVVGFRPSTGRYPGDGIVNLSWTRDTAGLHTRSVQDARIVDRAITRSALRESGGRLGGVRIGVLSNRFADAADEIERISSAALRQLESDGAESSRWRSRTRWPSRRARA
ncbi:amidase family protein [Promicromonospora soli]